MLGLVMQLAYAAGEEIGWRGYFVLRLIDARVPFPILVSGMFCQQERPGRPPAVDGPGPDERGAD